MRTRRNISRTTFKAIYGQVRRWPDRAERVLANFERIVGPEAGTALALALHCLQARHKAYWIEQERAMLPTYSRLMGDRMDRQWGIKGNAVIHVLVQTLTLTVMVIMGLNLFY